MLARNASQHSCIETDRLALYRAKAGEGMKGEDDREVHLKYQLYNDNNSFLAMGSVSRLHCTTVKHSDFEKHDSILPGCTALQRYTQVQDNFGVNIHS